MPDAGLPFASTVERPADLFVRARWEAPGWLIGGLGAACLASAVVYFVLGRRKRSRAGHEASSRTQP